MSVLYSTWRPDRPTDLTNDFRPCLPRCSPAIHFLSPNTNSRPRCLNGGEILAKMLTDDGPSEQLFFGGGLLSMDFDMGTLSLCHAVGQKLERQSKLPRNKQGREEEHFASCSAEPFPQGCLPFHSISKEREGGRARSLARFAVPPSLPPAIIRSAAAEPPRHAATNAALRQTTGVILDARTTWARAAEQ